MSTITRSVWALTVVLLTGLFGTTTALANGECFANFSSYLTNVVGNSATLNNGSCQACHLAAVGAQNVNGFGRDLQAELAKLPGGNCKSATALEFADVLAAVNPMDSDGEGNTNAVEIGAGTQPGWCDAANPGCTNLEPPPSNIAALDPMPANQLPVANVGGPYSGVAGETLITFDGSGSFDPDGDALTSYAWDFGDGTNGTGITPTHTYATAGSFPVTLVVNDGTADSTPSVTSAEITEPVVNAPPRANPGGPYTGQPNVAVAFDGTGSSDPNGDSLTYSWDFGDGSMGTGPTPTHIYAADGVYEIGLTVNDGQLDSAIGTTIVEIATPPANSAPVADAGGPYSGSPGVAVSFDGSGSTDPNGDPLTYAWNFGDGMTGTGPTPNHVYATAGNYEVTLVVSDGVFESAPATTTAGIVEAAESDSSATLYDANCASCHGDPWGGPAVDDTLVGKRRVAGARTCSIEGSIFGTSVFPGGVPEMAHLKGLGTADVEALAAFLNSMETSGEQRYVTACAGCHGNTGEGGRVREDVHGDSAHETREAIAEESEMRFLACLSDEDIDAITAFLAGQDDDFDDDGIPDDEDDDDDNDGIPDDLDDDDDNDGLSDDDEHEYGTDPRDDDSDDDGVNDGDEHEHHTDPLDADSDDDGLNDGEEREYGTDPNDPDTDNDGKSDGDEVKVLGTNPLVADNAPGGGGSGGGSPSLPALMMLLLFAAVRRMRARSF